MFKLKRIGAALSTLAFLLVIAGALVAQGAPEQRAKPPEGRPEFPAEEALPPEPDIGKADAPAPTLDPDAEQCARELVDVEQRLLSMATVARAAAACRSDSDCTLIDPSIPCQSMCETAVPRASADAVTAQIVELGRALCEKPRSCVMTPTCLPIERAACLEGQCVPDVRPFLVDSDNSIQPPRRMP